MIRKFDGRCLTAEDGRKVEKILSDKGYRCIFNIGFRGYQTCFKFKLSDGLYVDMTSRGNNIEEVCDYLINRVDCNKDRLQRVHDAKEAAKVESSWWDDVAAVYA